MGVSPSVLEVPNILAYDSIIISPLANIIFFSFLGWALYYYLSHGLKVFFWALFSQCLLSSWSCQDEAENLLPTCRCQKQIEVDDEGKLYIFYNKGVATEIAANVLDEGWRSVWFQ